MLELNSNLLADIGGWPALKEARGLVERKKVSHVRREGAVIRARVHGAEKIYDAQITLADRVSDVEVRCTCAESRRRVCPHILAAGLAAMQAVGNQPAVVAADVPIGGCPPSVKRLSRFPLEDSPVGIPAIEITVLLPLQLKESLGKDPVRIILEARRRTDERPQPWDAISGHLKNGFAVAEEDDQILTALENATGTVGGINAVPRAKVGAVLHALRNHPRVWLGKKQRVEVEATDERPQIILSTREGGALELAFGSRRAQRDGSEVAADVPIGGPSRGPATATEGLPITGWSFDGQTLMETPTMPAGMTSGSRIIPAAQIPDFLSREFPMLERSCEIVFAPGFAEFQLELGQPTIEARLDGALSGLTLDLVARYDGKDFALTGKTEPSIFQRYEPDTQKPNRFWRRNVLAEREALAQAQSSGFALVRNGATTFSLLQEKQVARFLANVLPRWKRNWTVIFGSRLEATMRDIDIAEPEFSLKSGSGEDWLSLDLKLSVGGKPVELDQAEIQRWLQTGQNHGRTANKRILLVPTEAWGEMREVLADCEVEQDHGKMRVGKTFAPFLSGALSAQGFRSVTNVSVDWPKPDVTAAFDSALAAQLRPYQLQGVEWMASLAQQKLHGLLADDMGLGKTLQALAFCSWLKVAVDLRATVSSSADKGTVARRSTATTEAPALVVCPTSLVTNWLREAGRFTPHLRTLDLTGTDRAEKWAKSGEYDLLVTSYAILRRDIELYRAEEFLLVILDEAQHIKNRGSQNAQSAKALRARHRLILSGTPLENSVLDLWSLYDFLLPGYLGTATEFKEKYETPLAKGAPDAKTMERLRHRVKPFFLRRTKEEVLTELPPKLEHLTLCELSDEQREVYKAVLAQGRRDVFESSGKQGKGRDRIAVLTTLLRLRQVSCHLGLLPKSGPDGAGPSMERWKEPSAKMERTFELIDEAIDGGHRVLLFSQFVQMLHLLRDEAKRREMSFCYLDGQTVERQAEVDRFQNSPDVPIFFISLTAGGTGLNLTEADTVIHFDPWWNPAVEEQATSRAHRMGQSRSVQAYKLIAAGTVEEKIQALQARKRELFEASLGGDAAFVEKLTGDDLEELLAE
jgi:superfamily II DNA or RNA helicase